MSRHVLAIAYLVVLATLIVALIWGISAAGGAV